MALSTVTSEALQLKLRQLLPSQQGFGTDLSASDTIIPIIDLTAAAEGSDVPLNLQTAQAFGSQTSFSLINTTGVIANTAGFWQIKGIGTLLLSTGGSGNLTINVSDGVTNKDIYVVTSFSSINAGLTHTPFDLTVFLAAGESVNGESTFGNGLLQGSARQIADINGTLIQPSGFTPQ
jgi:hypothetical protein